MLNDLAKLDYVTIKSTQAASTPVNPCNISGYKGPLVGLVDPYSATGAQFCNGSGGFTTGDHFAGNNPATGKPWLMHEILRDSGINGNYFFSKQAAGAIGNQNYPGGWAEWYAQSFRDVAYPQTGGSTAYPVPDGVQANGYFACTAGTTDTSPFTFNGWLADVYKGNAVALPSSCTTAVPGWFKTLIEP